MRSRQSVRLTGLVISLCLFATACASTEGSGASSAPSDESAAPTSAAPTSAAPTSAAPAGAPAVSDWAAVQAAAQGRTVKWWLYGGDDQLNRYIDDNVVPAAADLGVTLERVPVDDTASAVQRVVAETQAGTTDGSVDMIWINGENFALGADNDLWLDGWATDLPNAQYVDPATVEQDFGVPIDGQESPWSGADFIFAYDTARMDAPPKTFDALLQYAKDNPGRLTYPAPPDFTGSAFVRQAVQAMGEDAAFAYLAELEPLLYKQGNTHPESEAELNRLFGDGQVDLAMSYGPSLVKTEVEKGTFPETTRPFVLDNGTLHNFSFVTIPDNAANREGALVVANLLLSPEQQAIKADPDVTGIPTVLDLSRLDEQQLAMFTDAARSPYLLTDFGTLLEELPASQVDALEQRWRDEILP